MLNLFGHYKYPTTKEKFSQGYFGNPQKIKTSLGDFGHPQQQKKFKDEFRCSTRNKSS
jgi:hypothetical protein